MSLRSYPDSACDVRFSNVGTLSLSSKGYKRNVVGPFLGHSNPLGTNCKLYLCVFQESHSRPKNPTRPVSAINAQVSLFNISPRKRPIDLDDKCRRMETLRLQLCTALPRPPMALADELEMHTNNELIDMLAAAPLGSTSTAFLPVSPVRAIHQSPPPSVLLPVYQRLLSAILVQSGNIRTVDRVELQNMTVRISQSTRAAIVPSDDLGRLFMQLGVPLSASLYLKPSVIAWLTSTSSLPEDVVSFQLGFYVAPTGHIYEMIKADDKLPPFVTNAKHGLAQNYQAALHSAKQRAGVRPILMMLPVQQNEIGPLFHGSNMLVLGSVGSGGE